MKINIISFCLLLLLTSCGVDEKMPEQAVAKIQTEFLDTSKLDLLLFKEDKALEVWQSNEGQTARFLNRFNLNGFHNWPIGCFEWEFDLKSKDFDLIFQFPDSIYNQKKRIATLANIGTSYSSEISSALSKDDQKQILDLTKGNYKSGRLIIFPNKPSKNQQFNACLNCPHWTAELYALLELELKNYPINHGN